MLIYQGKSVYGGIAIGKIKFWGKKDNGMFNWTCAIKPNE